MVGAKQFAIRRKVTPAKRINPILAAIKLPSSMKSNEAELDDTSSFLNKHKREPFSLAKMIQKPIARPKANKPDYSDAAIKKPVVSGVPFLKTLPRIQPKEEESSEDKDEDISDELANRITYKVLKNIKNYLNPQRDMGAGGRHIKLEISL